MSKWNKKGGMPNPIGFWLCIGIGIGLGIGVAIESLVTGIGVGVVIGLVIGMSQKQNKNDASK